MSPFWDRNENRQLKEIAGHQVERDLFGEFLPPSNTPPLRPGKDETMFGQIITRHEQPDFSIDPEDPKAPYAAALLNSVREALGSSTMRFYTSTGSPLDWHLGIDGFFEDQGVRVSIDIKTSNQAEGKADLIENVPDTSLDPVARPKEFAEYVERLSKRIVQKFKILSRKA